MDRTKQIERRIGKIKQALAELGDMRPGSISTQTRAWGGKYHQLSYTHQGRGRTEYVPPDRLRDVKRQLASYKKFKELTNEWTALAIELCKLRLDEKEGS
jgi:hypothetical protein